MSKHRGSFCSLLIFLFLLVGTSESFADTRTWSGGGINALASNSANWLEGSAPVDGDSILLNTTSSKDMTWDLNISVDSWEQNGYSGTVTFPIFYEGKGAFNSLVVDGNCAVMSGVWTHPANSSAENYRIFVEVGGNFTLGSGGTIDVISKGYSAGNGPGAGVATHGAGSHGGIGIYRTDTGTPGYAPGYGNMFAPTNCGSGGRSTPLPGGGAVRLLVNGSVRIDGVIKAESPSTDSGNARTGSGGSVWITAGSLTGSGLISANGGSADCGGGGGRIAVHLTGASSDFSNWDGFITTYGGTSRSSGGMVASAGTVYLETLAHTPGQGVLIIDNNNRTTRSNLGVVTWLGNREPVEYSFSEIFVIKGGSLGVFTNEVLDISAATGVSITLDGVENGIYLFDGSTLKVDDNYEVNSFVLSIVGDNVNFAPSRLEVGTGGIVQFNVPFVITGEVYIAEGGIISHEQNTDSERFRIDLTVIGDMTVSEGGSVDVRGKGYTSSRGPGGGSKASYGGRGSYNSKPCYGSIRRPVNLGSGSAGSNYGGGAVKLQVSGHLSIDGLIDADGLGTANDDASGGSIWLESGTISGSGAIRARGGNCGFANWGAGGGRISLN
ncbi:MAG: hypothetical protein GX811_02160, partial [Lentisphaerae bacterium]|nr:hypothetical protein [Lentisphaerota bacterium]